MHSHAERGNEVRTWDAVRSVASLTCWARANKLRLNLCNSKRRYAFPRRARERGISKRVAATSRRVGTPFQSQIDRMQSSATTISNSGRFDYSEVALHHSLFRFGGTYFWLNRIKDASFQQLLKRRRAGKPEALIESTSTLLQEMALLLGLYPFCNHCHTQ